MKINLNARVSFTLTEAGAKIWNQRFDLIPEKYRPVPRVADEVVVDQLWGVMQVFGPHTQIGGDTLILGNNLEVEL